MQRIFLLFAIAIFSWTQSVQAQYGNEWIDHTKTYYKFKVGADGLYRINAADLSTSGLGSALGNTFTIYRNGVKIPIFVSTNGAFGTSDYIEFYGQKNKGEKETELYTVATNHPTTDYSLITDTAVYFLVSMTGPHPRITNQVNTIPTPAPTPAPYFWFESKRNNGVSPTQVDLGKNYDNSGAVFYPAGDFDAGEGRSYGKTATSGAYNLVSNMNTRGRYTTIDLPAKIKYVLTNLKLGATGKPNLYIGTIKIGDTTYAPYKTVSISKTVLTSQLGATSTSLPIYDTTGRTALNYLSVEYPRIFNYTGFTNSKTLMKVDAYASATLLSFTNVPSMGSTALLYDITNNKRYQGQNVTATGVSFMINAGADNRELFFSGISDVVNITQLEAKTFVNFTNIANQGNYLIVTHKDYIDAPASPITSIKNYRQSALGGGHNAKVIDVQELIDQYGYGAIFSPIGMKNFFRQAYNTWATPPNHIFLIGKGITYTFYRNYENNPSAFSTNQLVPTFGHPGSDNMLVEFTGDHNPDIAIGRISVLDVSEIEAYYQKILAYENAIRPNSSETYETSIWKKRSLFVAGGDANLQTFSIMPTFNTMMNKFVDTFVGGVTQLVRKGVPNVYNIGNSDLIDSVVNAGVSRIFFYGHASSAGFEYSLNDPNNFNINPKFPVFYGFGCDVAQIFGGTLTIGERYLKSVNGGSIALIACDNFGWVSSLTPLANSTMDQISRLNYGATVGKQFKEAFVAVPSSSLGFIHKQCFLLQGDPGLQTFNPTLADYYLSDSLVKAKNIKLNIADSFFRFTAYPYNIGKANNDSVKVDVLHTLPDGSSYIYATFFKKKIKSNDSFQFTIPINPIKHLGINTFTVRVNNNEAAVEANYANNNGNIQIEVLPADIVPVFPYEFSIVYTPTVHLKAMALDVFTDNQNYRIQVDTTERFNSPFLKTQNITNSLGGLIEYTPTMTMADSTVYYWRTGVIDGSGNVNKWNYSSFIYLASGSDGWNQSHYYQYVKNPSLNGISTEEYNRPFKFNQVGNELLVRNRVYNSTYPSNDDVSFRYRDTVYEKVGCNLNGGNIRIAVFDSISGNPLINSSGDFGSMPYCFDRNKYVFEYKISDSIDRKKAADFIASIPNGQYVLVQNLLFDMSPYLWNNVTVTNMYQDTSVYGYENSLIGRLKQIGFHGIDSFTSKRVFAYFTKKGATGYSSQTHFTEGDMDLLSFGVNIPSLRQTGTMTSVVIGPASSWTSFIWNPYTYTGTASSDTSRVQIFGITSSNTRVSLYNGTESPYSLSSINATTYPRLELVWTSKDVVEKSSQDLDFWRIIYAPYPDVSIDPKSHLTNKDTVYQGETVNLKVAYRNISNASMDSVTVKVYMVNNQGVETLLLTKKHKPLNPNDTFISSVNVNTQLYPGQNYLKFVANEGRLIKEQILHNNVGYLNLFVIQDLTRPDINVAFNNMEITGNVATNDVTGCTYTGIVAKTGNPSTNIPTLNTDGTYTFTSYTTGQYYFDVTVCKDNACVRENLKITVLPSIAIATSKPIANTDLSITKTGTAVTINILANDKAIAPTATIANSNTSVSIVGATLGFKSLYEGNVAINANGTITYTPPTGFVGIDVINYTVCDNLSNCADAQVFVRVIPTSMDLKPIISDDYNLSEGNAITSGNLLINDTKGNSGSPLRVTPQSLTNAYGTLTVQANGDYTYTPSGYDGTIIYEYEVCDTALTPDVCTKGTLVIQSKTVPLAINLLSFDAVPQGKDVLVTWRVDDEKDVSSYEVLHSVNGQDYTKVGSQVATGALQYSLVHASPVLGNNYYKLKIYEDNPAVFQYSNVKIVVFGDWSVMSIFPNPATDYIVIKSSVTRDAIVTIHGIDGKEVYRGNMSGSDFRINTESLPSGVYTLMVRNDGFEFKEKVVINK